MIPHIIFVLGFSLSPFLMSLLCLAHVQCDFFFPMSLENWQFDFLLVKAADYQAPVHFLKVLSDLGE